MRFKAKVSVVFLSTLITLYAIIGGFLSKSTEAVAKGSQYAQYAIFDEVLGHIIHDYVDEPDLEKVRIGSLRGLAEGLDVYSAYLTVQQLKQYDPNPSPGATGMILSKVGGFVYVVGVIKGSAADQAGIKDGDFIEYVGTVASRDLSLYDATHLLGGDPGTPVTIRIVHQGQSRKVTFNLAKLVQPPIEGRIQEPGIGYIKVTSLADGKAAEVKRVVADLVSKGAQKLVLDLRDASNGTLDEGVAVANLFVGSGTLAEVIGKEGKEAKVFQANPDKVVFTGPLSVVIDHSTAGPAEVIAAAVRDQKRGDVVGDRTFGMGSDQKLFSLSDGGALLITVAKYAAADGKPFMDEAVEPTVKVEQPVAQQDLIIPDTDEDTDSSDDSAKPAPPKPPQPKVEPGSSAAAEDLQLKKAVELLKQAPAKAQAAQKRAELGSDHRVPKTRVYERKHAA
ncbi:MAG TPA: S41 family peptidase [Blastocatellia bacterium]|nr:S41 family peptidase [Blastocatellia bacterium]